MVLARIVNMILYTADETIPDKIKDDYKPNMRLLIDYPAH